MRNVNDSQDCMGDVVRYTRKESGFERTPGMKALLRGRTVVELYNQV
jgi:hypothetical protein